MTEPDITVELAILESLLGPNEQQHYPNSKTVYYRSMITHIAYGQPLIIGSPYSLIEEGSPSLGSGVWKPTLRRGNGWSLYGHDGWMWPPVEFSQIVGAVSDREWRRRRGLPPVDA